MPSHRRSTEPLRFVGVDGEGVTRTDGTHDYVLLSVGSKSLHHDGAPLRLPEILNFLWQHYVQNPSAVYVGFALGYDWSQWFKGLPEDRARLLFTDEGKVERTIEGRFLPYWVRYGGWRLDMLPHKQLRIAHRRMPGVLYLNDTFSFFQTSFLKAIDPATWPAPIVSDEEYHTLSVGKALRTDATFSPEMIAYNVLENKVLARLMTEVDRGFRSFGVYLDRTRWYGPGAAASKWLRQVEAPRSASIAEATPPPVLDAARESYYGGWFELTCHGHVPGFSYEYDLNSAYPFIISYLPCLLHGEWTQDADGTDICLVHARVRGSSERTGPMLYRNPKGLISRPLDVGGWYWLHELQAAARAGLLSEFQYDQCWEYRPCCCTPPYESIRKLYETRLEVGKNTPQGKGLKLVYNSVYGKMAQSVGTPTYASAIYASLITACCRTMILDAIASHPSKARSLLMVATDGVSFREQHPGLPLSNRLGEWSEQVKSNLTLAMPGVYWDDAARAAVSRGEIPPVKSRGVSASDIAQSMAELDSLFDRWTGSDWPKVTVPIGFDLMSPTQALQQGRWDRCGRVRTNAVRKLSTDPSDKRVAIARLDDDLWRTLPYPYGGYSTPYQKTFGQPWLDYEPSPIEMELT